MRHDRGRFLSCMRPRLTLVFQKGLMIVGNRSRKQNHIRPRFHGSSLEAIWKETGPLPRRLNCIQGIRITPVVLWEEYISVQTRKQYEVVRRRSSLNNIGTACHVSFPWPSPRAINTLETWADSGVSAPSWLLMDQSSLLTRGTSHAFIALSQSGTSLGR